MSPHTWGYLELGFTALMAASVVVSLVVTVRLGLKLEKPFLVFGGALTATLCLGIGVFDLWMALHNLAR